MVLKNSRLEPSPSSHVPGHNHYRKRSIPAAVLRQELCFGHCKRDIHKAGLAFELGCDSKAQQDVERDMAVVPALVWQNLCKVFNEPMSFHRKDDVVNQVTAVRLCQVS